MQPTLQRRLDTLFDEAELYIIMNGRLNKEYESLRIGIDIIAHDVEYIVKDIEFCHDSHISLRILIGEDEKNAIVLIDIVRDH